MNKTIFLKINRHTRCGEVGITWPVDYDETADEEGNLGNVTRMVDKIHRWGDTLHPGMMGTPEKPEKPEKPPEKPEEEEAPPPPPVEETPSGGDAEAEKRAADLPARPGAKKKAARKKAAGKKTVRASSLRKRTEGDVPPEPPISREDAEDALVDFAECCVDAHPEITEYNDEDYDKFVMDKLSEITNSSFDEMCKLPKSRFVSCIETAKTAVSL